MARSSRFCFVPALRTCASWNPAKRIEVEFFLRYTPDWPVTNIEVCSDLTGAQVLAAVSKATTCQLHVAENSFTLTTYISPFKANTSANWNAVSRQIWRGCHTSVDSGDLNQVPPKQSAVCFTCIIPAPSVNSVSIPRCPFPGCPGFLEIFHPCFPGNGRARFPEKTGIRKSRKTVMWQYISGP